MEGWAVFEERVFEEEHQGIEIPTKDARNIRSDGEIGKKMNGGKIGEVR